MESQDITRGVIKRDFKLTSLALKNRNTVFLLLIVLIAFGIYSYRAMPKELFPDIYIPTVMIQTIYNGNPPIDIENLITRPIEKEVESIRGIKTITSNSLQDVSVIFIEFTTGTEINQALQEVRDAVDKSKRNLPNDLLEDPMITDIDFSEFPIINISLSGEYSIDELKSFAEYLEDEIEGIFEISRVELTGINEREVKINVNPLKMDAFELSFDDIENAIRAENVSISGGDLRVGGTRRSLRVIGEFRDVREMENIIVKSEDQEIVYLRDLAEVIYGFQDPDSYARLDKQNVVTLQVIKKGGENLLNATRKIFDILDHAQLTGALPEALNVTITNDQSDMVKKQLSNLENSIVMGVIFVLLVLYFFLGIRNALFVGLAIPTSMFLSFMVMSLLQVQINMIVLFSLILALGMLVDNAIVAVENIYRFADKGHSRFEAARQGVGEIAMPIISSTATTLAAFTPLLFWDSLMGEFMKFLPITLMVVLTSSLFVALIIIPVISSTFIRTDKRNPPPLMKRSLKVAAVMIGLALIFYIFRVNLVANLLMLFAITGLMNLAFLFRVSRWFQERFLVWLENLYLRTLQFVMKKANPQLFILGSFGLLVLTVVFYFARDPEVEYFPVADPDFINIIVELPIGTDIDATDEVMMVIEDDVYNIIGKHADVLKSVMTIVGKGAVGENEGFSGKSGGPNRGLITVSFIDYEFRKGVRTSRFLNEFADGLVNKYPGVDLSVERQSMGPPVGKAINLEISGRDFDKLLYLTDTIMTYINQSHIQGIEGLKIDLDVGSPEVIVSIDREKARMFGLSTYQIASTLRTAIFGKEISDFKIGEDEYPIQLRLKEDFRYNIAALLNQNITFRSQASGEIIQVPISAVADIEYSTTYGSVVRKNLNRVITIWSNVIEGYNATEINNHLRELMANFNMPEGYKYEFTGEQQEQEESAAFLGRAMLIALSLILIILVSQFNSVVKPVIIMVSVLLSTIGVFGGLATFKMDFIVIMTGIGIVSLAGVVVNNAIVLIDYINLVKQRRKEELGLPLTSNLPLADSVECIVEAGKTRLRPVLLTAITTILGLLPLASGVNIDFEGMFTRFEPNIYFGGTNAAFWGPMSWTIIFGLTFATFLTLIIVPAMYHVLYRVKLWTLRIASRFGWGNN
jgi:multidrug efflux pump